MPAQDQRAVLRLQLPIDEPAEVQHLAVGEELHEIAVRTRGDQVDVEIVEPVRAQLHAVTGRGRGDAAELTYSAAHGGIRLENCGSVLVQ
jgi:hypothetical protein